MLAEILMSLRDLRGRNCNMFKDVSVRGGNFWKIARLTCANANNGINPQRLPLVASVSTDDSRRGQEEPRE